MMYSRWRYAPLNLLHTASRKRRRSSSTSAKMMDQETTVQSQMEGFCCCLLAMTLSIYYSGPKLSAKQLG
ncbi:hypothetical protein ATANTOWER_006521 [Ataeniobius toweri]|uniref:Uncharacterized protein n=1 Tax=Ataeniobius toweri TaxID=208326 RepID=A0ABU7C082_9TELE|nr:hypothetical protein [Ataeniobius toweri]